jgi:transposase
VPDVPARDEVAALRAANARLREVVAAKDTEIAALRTSHQAQLDVLRAQVTALAEEVADLRARVEKNPRNSSQPPSSEGLGKPAPKSLRKKAGRRPGRPEGQPGATLEMTDHPDHVLAHEPGQCGGCGRALGGAEVTGAQRLQVIDLPEQIRAEVTEHQVISRRCACGTVTAGAAPGGVSAPVQYGPRLSAAAVYLWHGQFLSRDRTCQALGELFGVPVSPGTVAAMARRAAAAVAAPLEVIRQALAGADVLHADETGFRVAGKLAWVHSASSGVFTLFTVHARRGCQAMDDAGVLPHFRGTLVHDCWAPYDTYDRLTHALCNAHALRELQAVIDAAPAGQWCWAGQAADASRAIKHLADAALAADGTLDHIDQDKLATVRNLYHSAVVIGSQQTAARAGPLMRKHNNLARRLTAREEDYLRYSADPRVPYDNNRAEQDIRMAKLRIKVSGCMRSMTGARQFCAIRSYLATAARHGIGKLDALTRAASGTPWMPQAP